MPGLFVATLGLTANVVAVVLTQVQAPAPEIAPWVSAGGSFTAVGALVYVARLMATGKLVARDTAAREERLLILIERADRRETRSEKREEELVRLLRTGRPRNPRVTP